MLQYDKKINTLAVYSNTAAYSITNIKLPIYENAADLNTWLFEIYEDLHLQGLLF